MPDAVFAGFDLANFWDDSDYTRKQYVEEPPTKELIASVEQELGYKLPAAYIALMEQHNGGVPVNTCFPTKQATSWADDHVAITGIAGIGRTRTHSLCGELGSQFMLDEWGYPAIGVCICDCPSAGHDMVMLDYSACGAQGEPTVVHVDQEDDYAVTFLAPDFESFIRGLINEQVYDTSADDLQEDLARIKNAAFSPLLTELLAKQIATIDYGQVIRNICHQLTTEKQYFALHADALSTLLYDVQFLLYSQARAVTSKAKFLKAYPDIIALDGDFSTNGYAEDFIAEWFDDRRAGGQLIASPTGKLTFSEAYERDLQQQLQPYIT